MRVITRVGCAPGKAIKGTQPYAIKGTKPYVIKPFLLLNADFDQN